MTGWTLVTLRGKKSKEYEYSRWDNNDRIHAVEDIVATVDESDSVRSWTTWEDHVYALLNGQRYNFSHAEELFERWGEMLDDAVVLGWDDTTDTGTARYYERPDLGRWIMSIVESQSIDGIYKGELALAKITAQYGIVARNPFQNQCGRKDEMRLKAGNTRLNKLEENDE